MSLYEGTENDLITSFGDEVKRGIINPHIVDLSFRRASTKYNQYIDRIEAFKPREYKTDDFTDIEFKDIVNMSLYIIRQIFSNIDIEDELIEYFTHLQCSGSEEILNGMALYMKSDDGETMRVTEIPNAHKTSSIVTLVHEFIHFHCSKQNITYNKKLYYEEILSIYAEKLAIYYLTRISIEPDFMRKIEETRLESIVWHYKVHPREINFAISSYQTAKSHMFIPEYRLFVEQAEKALPWIRTASATKTALQYKENMAAGYGLGYLYAESLLKRYFESQTITEGKIRKVLLGEESIQDLLDYFGINASNNEVYDTVDQKLSLLRK